MKKKHVSLIPDLYRYLESKISLKMRATLIVFLICIGQTFAVDVYSQNKRLSLNMTNVTIKSVLSAIEDQSEFYFMYEAHNVDVEKKVTISAENKSVPEILNDLFANTEISYKINNRQIALSAESASSAGQQILKVTGKVTDSGGMPLPGVSIVIKGKNTGTISDSNGSFVLPNVPADAVLLFSFVGMKAQEVKVAGKTNINVVLVEESVGIEEVVAVGYGVSKKSNLTGSIGSVSEKSFENQPVVNISSALQGRAAGVSISNVSGAPGGDIRIRIRGANSINGGNDPLFVVDGMQLSSFNFNDLNPADLGSVEILKDAAATAIYGSRGANGVVMITTKKGASEKAKVDFTVNYGIGTLAKKYNLLDPLPFAKQVNLLNPGTFSDSDLQKFANGFGTDWQDEIFQTGKIQDYQLSVSGSSAKSAYFISGRYLDQTGIVINSDYKKYSFHSNIDTKITDKISLSAGVFLNRSQGFNNQTVGSLRGGVEQAILWSPTTPVYVQNADGTDSDVYMTGDSGGAAGKNPVANLKNKYNKSIVNSAILNTKITYKIFDYLTLDIVGGVDANLSEGDNITGKYGDYASDTTVGSSRQHSTSLNLLNSNILTFHKIFNGVHDLTVTGVNEQSKSIYDYSYLQGQGSPFSIDQLIGYYSIGQQPTKIINAYYQKSQLLSYIGRVNYTFNGKYLLTASYRADGSSKFPNNKWGYFPSLGLAWRVSDESFMQNQTLLSNLKLRGSWGVTGNHGVGAFTTIPQMSTGTFSYGLNVDNPVYYVSNSGANPDLKWESTDQTDIGIDLGFLKNRINMTADYFNKQTKDLLLYIPTPGYWGGGSILSNIGQVENKGFEITLSGEPVRTKDFTWNSSINVSTYQNKVIALGGGAAYINSTITNLTGTGMAQNDMLRIIIGESLGTFWGLESQGIWQTNEAAEAAKYGLQPGAYKYTDLNGDHVYDSDDKMVIGHSMPKYTWSFDNTLKYKNLELNIFITAVSGNKINNFDYSLSTTIGGDVKRITNADVVPWTTSNPSNKYPSLGTGAGINDLTSSRFLQDGSFVRLKNISLSYRLPKSFVKGTPVKLSVSGQNMLTFTKFKGYDPEATSGGSAEVNQGVVSGAYPSARVITFSLNLNF